MVVFASFKERETSWYVAVFPVGNSPLDVGGMDRLEAPREWLDVFAV